MKLYKYIPLFLLLIGCTNYQYDGPGTNPVSSLGISFPWDATETLPGEWRFTAHPLSLRDGEGWSDSVAATGVLLITKDTLRPGPWFEGMVVLDGLNVISDRFRFEGTTLSVGEGIYELTLEFPLSTQSHTRWVCAGGTLQTARSCGPAGGTNPESVYHLQVYQPE